MLGYVLQQGFKSTTLSPTVQKKGCPTNVWPDCLAADGQSCHDHDMFLCNGECHTTNAWPS